MSWMQRKREGADSTTLFFFSWTGCEQKKLFLFYFLETPATAYIKKKTKDCHEAGDNNNNPFCPGFRPPDKGNNEDACR
jgi:hypothetical protein